MSGNPAETADDKTASKVPAVTLAFWISKIAATTLGETGGDAVSMSLGLGYLVATMIFGAIFLVALGLQVFARRYHPFNYWFVIVATTTVGTTISDYLDRTAGLGYPLASLILFLLVLTVLAIWRFSTGDISVAHIADRKTEIFLLGHDFGFEHARNGARATIWLIHRVLGSPAVRLSLAASSR